MSKTSMDTSSRRGASARAGSNNARQMIRPRLEIGGNPGARPEGIADYVDADGRVIIDGHVIIDGRFCPPTAPFTKRF